MCGALNEIPFTKLSKLMYSSRKANKGHKYTNKSHQN